MGKYDNMVNNAQEHSPTQPQGIPMNLQSPMFMLTPAGHLFVVPVSAFIEALKHKDICLSCRHFVQHEDWREQIEGFQLPKGECQCHAPSQDGFPKLHGGKSCGEFTPSVEAKKARCTRTRTNAQGGAMRAMR
jgi:hypothetical protein